MLDCNKADSYVNPPSFYEDDGHDYGCTASKWQSGRTE